MSRGLGQPRRGRGADGERGAVLIVVSVAMVAVTTIAALALDVAQLRTDRRVNKSLADTAVRAGLGVLNLGPWSGICRTRDYLKNNSPALANFDAGSERWFQLDAPLNALTSSPCLNTGSAPFTTLCLPGALNSPRFDTWGKLTATAGGGRYNIEVQSGYAMPDSRFAEDSVAGADNGSSLMGSCDNLSVIITQSQAPFFGRITGSGDRTTRIRSVGRLGLITTGEYNPALLLLERAACDVLSVNSNNSRVIAQPYLGHPGVLQVDSANRSGCASNQAVLNGASTSGGPSIVACSSKALSPTSGCDIDPAGTGAPSFIGLYGLNFQPAGANMTSGAGTYGDTAAVRSGQSGRQSIDALYRKNVVALDTEARGVLTTNGTTSRTMPPGCAAMGSAGTCTGNGLTWLVFPTQTSCSMASLNTYFVANPLDKLKQNVWFNCDLNVNGLLGLVPLTLSGSNSYIVITGQLAVSSTFAITDPRTIFVGGRSNGNKIGLDIGNGGNLNVNNPVAGVNCALPIGLGTTRMVVADGAFNVASGGTAHLCQTFVYMANGYGKVPATNGTAPCTCAYNGTVAVGSGSTIDWVAPNAITLRRPTPLDVDLGSVPPGTQPYEDIGLWTEAGGVSSISAGGGAAMVGVYFLGNADQFTLTGNSGANVRLNAQFISRRMKVTGGATVSLVLSPYDSIPALVYNMVLVR
ncbi:MAG: hypothetical protein H0W70_00585 [Actinobacteria bacterium]|nr:hypothetical protein [Actinomycetota bacterium]